MSGEPGSSIPHRNGCVSVHGSWSFIFKNYVCMPGEMNPVPQFTTGTVEQKLAATPESRLPIAITCRGTSTPAATMSSGKRSFFAPKKKATNPFDSDSDDDKPQQRPARASSVPPPDEQRGSSSLFGAGDRGGLFSSAANHHYRNDFRDAGGLEGQSVQELEGYAAYKAEETTRRTRGCVRIAEEMRDTASKTLVTVHQQGQQIHRTHMMAVDIDQDLSRVTIAFSNFFRLRCGISL
jgi:hypothetical protein